MATKSGQCHAADADADAAAVVSVADNPKPIV
jgi:hypothetical protein